MCLYLYLVCIHFIVTLSAFCHWTFVSINKGSTYVNGESITLFNLPNIFSFCASAKQKFICARCGVSNVSCTLMVDYVVDDDGDVNDQQFQIESFWTSYNRLAVFETDEHFEKKQQQKQPPPYNSQYECWFVFAFSTDQARGKSLYIQVVTYRHMSKVFFETNSMWFFIRLNCSRRNCCLLCAVWNLCKKYSFETSKWNGMKLITMKMNCITLSGL